VPHREVRSTNNLEGVVSNLPQWHVFSLVNEECGLKLAAAATFLESAALNTVYTVSGRAF
jgi:hypothetical protein